MGGIGRMSNKKEFVNEIIEKIESDIKEGLDEQLFINDIRQKIEEYINELIK